MSDQKAYNRKLIEDFRASRGVSDDPFAGRPLLLLTTIGAKSGQRRMTPLMYVPDGDRLLVIASNAGAPAHPNWYRNLLAHPQATVEVGAIHSRPAQWCWQGQNGSSSGTRSRHPIPFSLITRRRSLARSQ